MNKRSRSFLCVVAAAGFLFGASHLSRAHQATTKSPGESAAAENSTTIDIPDWPYPKGAHEPSKPDDGKLFHIPGSSKSYTDTQINGSTSTVDWFPELHPPPPASVIEGKQGAYKACGQCHLIDGRGKPDTADLQGLPVEYFLQQLTDMKEGKRRSIVPRATLNDMIP